MPDVLYRTEKEQKPGVVRTEALKSTPLVSICKSKKWYWWSEEDSKDHMHREGLLWDTEAAKGPSCSLEEARRQLPRRLVHQLIHRWEHIPEYIPEENIKSHLDWDLSKFIFYQLHAREGALSEQVKAYYHQTWSMGKISYQNEHSQWQKKN